MSIPVRRCGASVSIRLEPPVVSKLGLFDRWPLVLIDLDTEEGIVGRSYLEPYLERSMRYLVPAIRDFAEVRKSRPIAPLDDFRTGRAGLDLIGLEGVSMIALTGLGMATWHALAKAANLPLAASRSRSPPHRALPPQLDRASQ